MTARSLRLRLLAASAVSIVLVLVVAGFGLRTLFELHLERRAGAELDNHLRQIAANLVFAGDGSPSLEAPLADPRFDQPYSGLYWQVREESSGALLRSRSLWDQVLALPEDEPSRGEVHSHVLPGPGGSQLLLHERRILFPAAGATGSPEGERPVRIAVALDRAEIASAGQQFAEDAAWALALLAALLILAAWLQVRVGLSPLQSLRRALAAVRGGTAERLEGRFPDEVQPLASELNDLLDEQEQGLARARARAADLAHGLKTPLTVLAGDARKLRARGESELADELDELTLIMRRHVERELARLPLTGRRGRRSAAADLAGAVAGIVAVLKRSPAGEALAWRVDLPGGLAVGVEGGDLSELLGPLLENAMQWARSAVSVRAEVLPERIGLVIEDDGPGVPEEALEGLVERGRRLDERRGGSGLGLAIVSDILEAYGGALRLANRAEGGLRAEVDLPRAGSQ